MPKTDRLKILIIDDSKIFSESVKEVLSNRGFSAMTDNGKGGAERIIKKIEKENVHIVFQDIRLGEKRNGIDILEEVRQKSDFDGTFIIMSCQGTVEDAKRALKLGADRCISKFDDMPKMLAMEIDDISARLAEKRKKKLLAKLRIITGLTPLDLIWEDKADIIPNKSSSESLLTSLNFKSGEETVQVAALNLTHTNPHLGSCLPIAYGCRRKCPICSSGNIIPYKGELSSDQMVMLEELILRKSAFYDNDFWLHEKPFFIAFMGSGDFAFNSGNCLNAMEKINSVFGRRVVFTVSTAFSAGIISLIDYATENKAPFVPKLQISLHGHDVKTRKMHVDSNEDPLLLLELGQKYARLTGTVLTMNYGLTDKNNSPQYLETLLSNAIPELTRVKISSLFNLPPSSKLKPADHSLVQFGSIARNRGFSVELFDESKQVGIKTGTHCGGMTNSIKWRFSST